MDDDFKMLSGKCSKSFKESKIDIFETSRALMSVYRLRGFSQVCNNIWDIKSKTRTYRLKKQAAKISEFPSANDALTG